MSEPDCYACAHMWRGEERDGTVLLCAKSGRHVLLSNACDVEPWAFEPAATVRLNDMIAVAMATFPVELRARGAEFIEKMHLQALADGTVIDDQVDGHRVARYTPMGTALLRSEVRRSPETVSAFAAGWRAAKAHKGN